MTPAPIHVAVLPRNFPYCRILAAFVFGFIIRTFFENLVSSPASALYLCLDNTNNKTYYGYYKDNVLTTDLSESVCLYDDYESCLESIRDGVVRLYTPRPVRPLKQMRKEQAEKSEKGLISGITEATSNLTSKLTSLPIVGGYLSTATSVLDAVTRIAKSVGLDQPTSSAASQPIIVRQTSSLATTSGLDTTETLGCSPANMVANDPAYFCENTPTCQFGFYKLRPALVRVTSFDGTFAQNQLITSFPVNPMFSASQKLTILLLRL